MRQVRPSRFVPRPEIDELANLAHKIQFSEIQFSAPGVNDADRPRKCTPMPRGTTEFRERVLEKYNQSMAQIDPILDRAIMLAQNSIGRLEDPASFYRNPERPRNSSAHIHRRLRAAGSQ